MGGVLNQFGVLWYVYCTERFVDAMPPEYRYSLAAFWKRPSAVNLT